MEKSSYSVWVRGLDKKRLRRVLICRVLFFSICLLMLAYLAYALFGASS